MIIRKATRFSYLVYDKRALQQLKEVFHPVSEEPNYSIFWAMVCEYMRFRRELRFRPQLAFNEVASEWNDFVARRLVGKIEKTENV